MLWNGFIVALIHTSKTSQKNKRMASSVCGLAGLLAMEPAPEVELLKVEEEDADEVEEESGLEV